MVDPRTALAVLLDATRALAQEQPLEEALQRITDALQRLLPAAEHTSVRLLDETQSELIAGARSGVGAGESPLTFQRGEGVIGWVAETDELARVDDTRCDPRFKPAPPEQGFGVGAIIAVPLRAGGKVVGVLSAASSTVAAFGEEDELLARLLANCTVPAIERARLARLSLTDHLTLAFNLRYLAPRLEQELALARRQGTPLSILFLDLDLFKRVNDEHGHAAGDQVLRVFADVVRGTVRRYDVLVRRGGEEFVLLMPSTSGVDAERAAQRIRESLAARPIPLATGAAVRQTVSIGVATYDGMESVQELEQRADAAMYEAKRAGRDTVRVAT